MFTILKKLYNYFSIDYTNLEYELNRQLDKLELEENDDDNDFVENKPQRTEKATQKEVADKKCFRKIGVITSLQSSHGVIDKKLLFHEAAVTNFHTLQVGARVEYLAYEMPDSGNTKVVKIEILLNDSWDEPEEKYILNEISDLKEENPKYFNIHQRSILGLIMDRDEDFLKVDTDYKKIDIELDSISLEFVPQIGDRIYLNCNVQTDIGFVDYTGEILQVSSIFPARSKTVLSFVSQWNDSWGLIDSEYYFTLDILQSGYIPNKGDKVSANVIESDQGKYVWRCIKIIPLEKATNSDNAAPSSNLKSQKPDGITMTDLLKFELKNLGDFESKELIMKNNGDKIHKVYRTVFFGKKSQSQLTLLKPRLNDSFLIKPGESKTFQFRAKAQFYGYSKEMVDIKFDGGFSISCEIEIAVGEVSDTNRENSIRIENKFKKNGAYASQVWSRKYNLVPGVGMVDKPRFIANRIGSYDVPERLRNTVLRSGNMNERRENLEEVYPCLTDALSYENYCYRLQLLLHLEEIEFFCNIRQYDRERAHFQREDEFLSLEIENLAEKRPSLMIGDSVRVTNPWEQENTDNRCYEGYINKVLYNRILLKFNPNFHSKYNGEDYRIEFFFSRFTFRKQHYAIKKVHNHMGVDFLFPQKIQLHEKLQLDIEINDELNLFHQNSPDEQIKWFNSNLNVVQKKAIRNILRGEARLTPYIIFGPPGTGKTITLIETILQLVTLLPSCRLLVATPSNSSADLIATRLIESEALQPGDFIRLVSHNLVERDLIPDHLKQYCATADIALERTSKENMIITESGLKLKCQLKYLGRHRITIGTCITLGTLLQMGFPKDHFTHILIDEAGQCLESEAMIPITQVDRRCGQIILAGDPMQLGPIVLNHYAAEKGLETSFLVRILNRFPYMKDNNRFPNDNGYDPRLVTKLIYNYRSLPSILNVYNDLFYDSELISMIDEEDSREVQFLRMLSDILPETTQTNHGVFFIGVRGENRQNPDSPSWYNPAEASSLFMFLIKLYRKKVKCEDIGIITPYQKQVRIIRNLLLEAGLKLPKIGSVEEFQGQEKPIILISTVRSKKSLLHVDLKHALGFVESKKRMNVAISRSRSLLVVFGNPHLLTFDPCWEHLIKYCIKNDAYSGCDLPSNLM